MAETFELYEAMLWEPPGGYFLLERHLCRLERSAAHFRFRIDIGLVQIRLAEFATRLPARPRKVRIEVSADGALFLEDVDVKPSHEVRLALATDPVDSRDEFLRHKTSRRDVYTRALAAHPDAQDVLLWNERGELTESCTSNLVVELDGRRLTPPVASGLLPGTFRAQLLDEGAIEERILPVDALARATSLALINSVRRCSPATLPLPR
jgi:branched-subunit amino acid aminotransferase/4-amino-4-deoxychorismate lyase